MSKKPKTGNAIMRMLNKILGEPIVGLDVTTSTGDVLTFPDVDAEGTPKVDDKAEVDGKPAEDGEYIDTEKKVVYVIAKGLVTEVKPMEDPAADPNADPNASAKDAEIAQLKADNAKLTSDLAAVTAKFDGVIAEVQEIKRGIISGEFEEEDDDGNGKKPASQKKPKGDAGSDVMAKLDALKNKKGRV